MTYCLYTKTGQGQMITEKLTYSRNVPMGGSNFSDDASRSK